MAFALNHITEDILHFVWEQRLFDADNLKTVSGERVEVIETGTRNPDAGPDFFNAKIRIEDTVWAGNIEIHKNSSDWQRHHHRDDKAYDNIILHVVQNNDRQIMRISGEEIPTLVLPFPLHLLSNYRQLIESNTWIPCQDMFRQIDGFLLKIGLNRLMVERLEDKTREIIQRLEHNNNDWNETFYQLLARNFGFKTNAVPFEILSKSLPQGIPGKHKDNLFQLEALFFGQSGLLHQELFGDDYFLKLRSEYDFLAKKYKLKPMPAHLWKFLRLRPVNFPTVRIAQFAALFHHSSGLFSRIIYTPSLNDVRKLFDVQASEYWTYHYKFNVPAEKSLKHLGETAIDGLIINTLIPALFVYGENSGKYFLKDKSLEWLDILPAENNSITAGWGALGIKAASAFESQALLQLKNRYCDQKRCLHCYTGSKLVRTL